MYKIKHIKQPTNNTCVHACLAMITGRDIGDIIDELGDKGDGITYDEEIGFYLKHEIPFNQLVRTTLFDGVYLITVPSLYYTNPLKFHRVVVQCKDGDLKVYDPCEGRGEFYTKDKFKKTQWVEIIQVG
jgi:hypothetical protein